MNNFVLSPMVLACRVILFKILLLLTSITLESWVYRRGLNLTAKTSVEYAIVTNLFSDCVGWLMFFSLESILPPSWKQDLLGYILLGKQSVLSMGVLVITVLSFFIFLFVKLKTLEFLAVVSQKKDKPQKSKNVSSNPKNKNKSQKSKNVSLDAQKKDEKTDKKIINQLLNQQNRQQLKIVLRGHTLSHFAMLILFFLQLL